MKEGGSYNSTMYIYQRRRIYMISAKMINRADVSGVNCFSFGGKRMPFGDGNVSATYKYKQMIN